ncbi:hypothetical protein [Maritimibacter sp. DP1N21-5]|uniref:COG4315 family predicted lipoprotein n=1 Tax=Maritimibacter sp. DP1N21-5 TaxID=2836867 RepID=UPI001C440408|nr:hypothetical protein [Maritimibacter sp. DP1N21-5]MBV7410081.1 hypothetical protein [Maritimibacter sp. DP1N21-5]
MHYPLSIPLVALLAATPPGQALSQEALTLGVTTNDEYGAYLVGPDDRPVYTLLTDLEAGDGQDPLDSCNEECREHWPVLMVEDELRVDDGLDPDLAETMDWQGERVATYGGHPLFYFVNDGPHQDPGGQGMFTYGGYWALLSPEGRPLRTDAMPAAGQE